MKEWDIIFADKTGKLTTLLYCSDEQPTQEEAARYIRAQLLPVVNELDLNDFQDRSVAPTARELKDHSSITITEIVEHQKP